MSGLNDEWLADDGLEQKTPLPVKVFKERTPGEVPEISDHATIIAMPPPADDEAVSEDGIVQKTGEIASVAIEEFAIAVRDLGLLKDKIDAQGGMSLQIAQESLAVLPGFVNDDVRPMGFFTKHPSKTQLNEALEAISDTMKNMAEAAVKKIYDFIEILKNRIEKIKERIQKYLDDNNAAHYKGIANDLRSVNVQDIPQETLEYIAKHTMKKSAQLAISGSAKKELQDLSKTVNALRDYFLNGTELDNSVLEAPMAGDEFAELQGTGIEISEIPELLKSAADLAEELGRQYNVIVDFNRKAVNDVKVFDEFRIRLGQVSHDESAKDVYLELMRRCQAFSKYTFLVGAQVSMFILVAHLHKAIQKKAA